MSRTQQQEIRIASKGDQLEGTISLPIGARGLVLFAHGSGSGRFSPRNRAVADSLYGAGLATILMDLLTRDEEAVDQFSGEHRFDIPLLATRVVDAIDWAHEQAPLRDLPIGLFGASTGAAAALAAAAERPSVVGAVVSRGGRPDLAGRALEHVEAPTLLVVGGDDEQVIVLNRQALRYLKSEKQLEIVDGASHLFEEPGTLATVSRLATRWFLDHLTPVQMLQKL